LSGFPAFGQNRQPLRCYNPRKLVNGLHRFLAAQIPAPVVAKDRGTIVVAHLPCLQDPARIRDTPSRSLGTAITTRPSSRPGYPRFGSTRAQRTGSLDAEILNVGKPLFDHRLSPGPPLIPGFRGRRAEAVIAGTGVRFPNQTFSLYDV
jgi:hypothetical protein